MLEIGQGPVNNSEHTVCRIGGSSAKSLRPKCLLKPGVKSLPLHAVIQLVIWGGGWQSQRAERSVAHHLSYGQPRNVLAEFFLPAILALATGHPARRASRTQTLCLSVAILIEV